ncbi:Hypothetical_protein [Hexamita inflata]|uniref:Hypothetical_protein n=1 Tax=Hexamita inflata TaxID=28002 RepID=A0AA86NNW7_9EUKA|nr:Hypothetical protein HINF_LOCUS11095 [Hexamita inflata]
MKKDPSYMRISVVLTNQQPLQQPIYSQFIHNMLLTRDDHSLKQLQLLVLTMLFYSSYLYFSPFLGQEWEKLHLVCIFSNMYIHKRPQISIFMHMFLRSMISQRTHIFIKMRMKMTICR